MVKPNKQYEELFDSMPIGLYMTTPSGDILDVNTALIKTLRYPDKETLLEKEASSVFVNKQDRQKWIEEMECNQATVVNEYQWNCFDGTVIWVRDTASARRDEKSRVLYYIGVIEDITERKQAETILKSSEEQLKILFDDAPDAYYLNDLKGYFLDGNKAAEKVTGYNREELIGKNFLKLKLLPANQMAKAARGLARNALGKGTGPEEYVLNRKDGSHVPVEINTHPVKIQGKKVVLGIARDLTKQKLAETMLKEYTENLENIVDERTRELRKAQEELIRKERLAILGKLAGGIGHELRTPLGAIKNAIYLLNMAVEKPEPEIKEMLEVIENEISISNGIITGLLDFARPKEAKKQEVDVNSLLQETLSRVHVPENIEVEKLIYEKLPQILADQVQIGQIFTNIIQNGVQAMPDGGKLAVGVKTVDSDQVAVLFSDTGVGISEENLKKLFEPLFTTKASGTGLGLALVKMLVERNGGAIQVDSKLGEGSTFTVTFPAGGETGE